MMPATPPLQVQSFGDLGGSEMLHRKWLVGIVLIPVVAIGAIVIGVLGVSSAGTDPGPDDVLVGPNATLTLESGEAFSFGLKARLLDHSMLMGLNGAGISSCSIHGPSAQIDFVTEDGNFPLQGMQCGRSFGNDVALQGCTVDLEFHGFVHSDRPTRIYFGPMTEIVEFQKTGTTTGQMHIRILTANLPIVLQGSVQTTDPIVMSSCP
jgi:hypothetical protein